jgi:hypothetical protein
VTIRELQANGRCAAANARTVLGPMARRSEAERLAWYAASDPVAAGDRTGSSAHCGLGYPMSFGRVLAVEDQPQVMAILRETLRHLGYEASTAASAEQAIAARADVRPHVVFLDLQLLGISGLSSTARRRQETRRAYSSLKPSQRMSTEGFRTRSHRASV